jgi:putative ABC transport system substrate-binding protein
MKPDAIFAFSTVAVAALRQQSRTVPIVFTAISDPVGQRLRRDPGASGRQCHRLHQFRLDDGGEVAGGPQGDRAAGPARHAAVQSADRPLRGAVLPPPVPAEPAFGVQASAAVVLKTSEIEAAMSDLAREPDGGLVVPPDNFSYVHRELIFTLATRHRLPAVYPFRFMACEGGLVSYGVDLGETFPRAAEYIDRILKGEKPADLPVQAPTKFEFLSVTFNEIEVVVLRINDDGAAGLAGRVVDRPTQERRINLRQRDRGQRKATRTAPTRDRAGSDRSPADAQVPHAR